MTVGVTFTVTGCATTVPAHPSAREISTFRTMFTSGPRGVMTP
ncbi:hypothetical protein HMPREF9577_01286 [Cutibacterium acnes HL110PA3]|nr:hypothetical protein HMPREF9577_01286 [Cutibacterium acnes HL110PA3]EGE69943.1 hypothetical protein HMPREF9341_01227 [Cutibacterium acnes HL103PA1]MCW5114266.1 hypothetical protein [Cutibacterium acnes P05]